MANLLKNGYGRLKVPILVTVAEDHVAAVDELPLIFIDANPSQPDTQNAIDEAKAAAAAASGGDRYLVAVRDVKVAALVAILQQRNKWVEMLADGDITIAIASKLMMAKQPEPSPPIQSVDAPKAENGVNKDEIVVTSQTFTGATYMYLYSTDATLPVDTWPCKPSRRRKKVLKGLQLATRYYLAVAVLGPDDQLVYSGITTIVTQ